jgi:murein L,D-transpeptidase YcbB/YkuD
VILFFAACGSDEAKKPNEKDIVQHTEQLNDRISKDLREILRYALQHDGQVSDTTAVSQFKLVYKIYQGKQFKPLWSDNGSWLPLSDSLLKFISESRNYGLFASDYHLQDLANIRRQVASDSIAQKDAVLWTRADIFFTDAFLLISRHLKQGRIPYDSLIARKDTFVADDVYVNALNKSFELKQLSAVLHELEPKHEDYHELKEGLKAFLDSADFSPATYLSYPYEDSVEFYKSLQQRLVELDFLPSVSDTITNTDISKAISKFQKSRNLNASGKINEATVNFLNLTDWIRFKNVAVTLDKWKHFPDTLPSNYVLVNIPAYSLKVVEDDSVVLRSRTIVGTAKTQTPELNSAISNFITYPQWTVPYSIVFKEMVPQIKKDTAYLTKQNLMIVDRNDNVVPASTVNWAKANKNNFPYQIKQRQGDDNSLGVLKFNFRNKYSVYLHDTNARWLFSKTNRALSHGCVRVQQWRELAHYLVRNDTLKFPIDTLQNWIQRQEKHMVAGFPKVPIYIRYFTTAAEDGRIRFYDDIYSADKLLIERFLRDKSIN